MPHVRTHLRILDEAGACVFEGLGSSGPAEQFIEHHGKTYELWTLLPMADAPDQRPTGVYRPAPGRRVAAGDGVNTRALGISAPARR